jgi:flagella basal body P-ring formation protein FlgA
MNRQVNQAKWKQWSLGLVSCLLVASAHAQALVSEPELLEQAQRWLNHALAEQRKIDGLAVRTEASMGTLDSRLRLASCSRVETYLPPGARLWGKTRVGLRCTDGASHWNVFVPVTVKAVGRAWVLRRDLAPGTVLDESDLMQAEVDWAEDVSPVLASLTQWQGQVANRALMMGQTLRQNMVRPAQVFQAGAQIRVLAQGMGFQIVADGQAMAAGVVGQMTRVKMDNGRVMSATVLDARTVRLEL